MISINYHNHYKYAYCFEWLLFNWKLFRLYYKINLYYGNKQKTFFNISITFHIFPDFVFQLEDLWNVVTSSIEIHYMGPYDSEFLTIMNPLLEICISHPRRLVKERSRRFWFATFAPSSTALKIPESFKYDITLL